jgi:hypothetical protein
MILAEQDDEWQDGRCHFRPETTTLTDARSRRRRWAWRSSWRADQIRREGDAL